MGRRFAMTILTLVTIALPFVISPGARHPSPDQRRADALTQLIDEHHDAPRSLGDRPRIVVTIRM